MPVHPNTATLTPPADADPNIITLAEYKAFMGITDTNDDAQITALLGAASMAVRNYTGRSFIVATGPATPRTYLYDGSGILDTDDFTSVTSITTDAGILGGSYPLDPVQYQIMPENGSTYYWILLYALPFYESPEMGFTRNLDVYAREHNYYRTPTLTVTAVWGWNEVPDDVKLATAWTIGDHIGDREDEELSSEAIESYSRSWATSDVTTALAVPNRARDLLTPYTRAA